MILETSKAPSLASSPIAHYNFASNAKGSSRSPALSTTSTADEDESASSPIIPPLSAPQLTERALNLLRTPPQTGRAESITGFSVNAASTQFYTASWGSPYETAYQPSSFGGIANTARTDQKSTASGSSERSDSPIRHLDFHTPFLRPVPAPRSIEPAGGFANVLAKRARRPAQGLTEDWIRAHTGGEFGEGANWLSDEEIESEHSSLSGSISVGIKLEKNSSPKTPTLKTFVQQKDRDRYLLPGQHHRHMSVETLKQEDFGTGVKKTKLSNMAEERTPLSERLSQIMDRQPPETPEKDPQWRAPILPQPSASPAPPHTRLKKKVAWKGVKSIPISIPMDDQRGQPGHAPKPMTKVGVANMNRDWQQLGYDTKGFNLGYASGFTDGSANCRSRDIWPDPEDVKEDRFSRQYRVNIPNRNEWDAHVRGLAEAKLRALGVSLPGDDDPPAPALPSRKSSISITRHASMSVSRRNSTMQYPTLPFSPPLPTGSATSSHMTQNQNPFSPIFTSGLGQSTSQSSNSPAFSQAPPYQNKYNNPRQSISFSSNGEHPFGSPFQFPLQASPGVWSPSQFGPPGMPRGGSPANNAFLSPSSPFSVDNYFSQDTSLRHQVLDAGARQSPRLQDLKEVEDLDEVDLKSPSKTPDASVLNRQHNTSASLQKEIDDAEYHLEEQMQRQLDHEDYSPHHSEEGQNTAAAPADLDNVNSASISSMKNGFGNSIYGNDTDKEAGPTLHHPQPHSRGHSLSQRPYTDTDDDTHVMRNMNKIESKLDQSSKQTNPPFVHDRTTSLASNVSNPWSHSRTVSLAQGNRPNHSGHSSKASLSGLNVAAKEFKFDPSSAFKPSQFAFGQNNFQPSVPFQAVVPTHSAFAFDAPARPHHAPSQSSFGSSKAFGSKINPDAPVFSPSNSTFNFSASGPTFKPNAAPFVPSAASSLGKPTSIFGNLNMADVVTTTTHAAKQPKKSNAIPIIRPDSPKEDETIDADGRITRSAGREKRARGEKGDGDSIPLFASQPLSETFREQSPPKENVAITVTADNKENATPSSDDEQERIPAQPHQRQMSMLDEAPNYDGSGWAPWESFHERKDAEEMNASKPLPIPKKATTFELYDPGSSEEYGLSQSMNSAGKGHKKNNSSLSAAAKPFEFRPSSSSQPNNSAFAFGAPSTKPDLSTTSPPAVKKPMKGLMASRYALPEPAPEPMLEPMSEPISEPVPESDQQQEEDEGEEDEDKEELTEHEPIYDPIMEASDGEFLEDEPDLQQNSAQASEDDQEDEISTHRELSFEEIDERMRAMNEIELKSSPVHKPREQSDLPIVDALDAPLSSLRLHHPHMRSDAPSPSPRRNRDLPEQDLAHQFNFKNASSLVKEYSSPIHRLNTASTAQSDWNDMLSEGEEVKLESRIQFFDGHVNDIVAGVLSDRLAPIERVLEGVMRSIEMLTAKQSTPLTRRDRRSLSGDLPQSDADDEDDEHEARRSSSPRADKKYEKIKAIVAEALAAHQPPPSQPAPDTGVLKVLEEMKEQFGQSMRLDLRGEDLRNIVEEAVDKRLPAIDEDSSPKVLELQAKLVELAEKVKSSEANAETEIKNRRVAEDRMSEVQRLLRISSEEEVRLRESLDESEEKLKIAEDARAKLTMRAAVMEATQETNQKLQSDALNRVNFLEAEVLEARRIASGWQLDAERALEAAKRHSDDAEQANETNAGLRIRLEKFRLQMEESTRIRDGMTGKFNSLQEDVSRAAREISEENSRRAKKEQELIARQEVLDAKLQAEARTRERLELEIERLESGERDAMRAVSENKRLESLLGDLRTQNHEAQQLAMRYSREFEEARESGLSEVQRTRSYMQSEIDSANHQVNVVRDEMEIQVSKLRAELDQVRLDSDTYRARNDMFLEEATEAKRNITDELTRRHERVIEDMQTRHESKLGDTIEDAHRAEQHLLERLSLSSAKTEHLQDRVSHLEEKLEIAQAAANAAAQAARTAALASPISTSPPVINNNDKSSSELPEKISPQALRESIMVLQEQLQDREQKIEKLEQSLSSVDLDAPSKISKRDDEITWLRELLGVRNADLQDIVNALQTDGYDKEAVRDAAIRLRANLQMEEQERERALNGGSAVNLPNIAAQFSNIRDAASPRIAQGVGSIAAAWGNWKKSGSNSVTGGTPNRGSSLSISSRPDNSTPSRSGLLSGLLTPPASTRTPVANRTLSHDGGRQPTAFGNTGRRLVQTRGSNLTPRAREKLPVAAGTGSSMVPPSTPPMMRKASYDEDADARATDDGFSFSEDGEDGDDTRGFYDNGP